MAKDPELSAHLEWLGYIQPVGLVVSPPALVQAQAHINRNIIPQHQRFLSCLPIDKDDQAVPQIDDFPKFVREVFDWRDSDLIAFNQANQSGLDVSGLEVVLPEYNETLRPTWVVPEYQSPNASPVSKTVSRKALAAGNSPAEPAASALPLTKTAEFRQTLGGAAKGLYADEPEASPTAKLESATELVSEDRSIVKYGENVTQSTDDESMVQSVASQPSNASRGVMLIQQVAVNQELDDPLEESDRRWHASPHARFERLLRETQVPAGLLTNGRNLRLVYAPRGETSGYLTFNVDEMTTVAGRPIFAAFHMLLNSDRLFNLEKKQRLPAILVESRKYQNTVSTQLAQQVMAALYEFLRGFQAADDQWNGRLLKDVLAHDPQHVYHGLLTVLMRTVFVLYAEDRNLLSNHPVYTNYYAITGLFERLRADAGQYPDTMDQRYGAWAQLLTLFRMIYEGGNHDELRIPARKGYLFDPKRYPFLEGVGPASSSGEDVAFPTAIPRVSDGVIYRVLNNLLILDGERLSYRSLDVEQIGSVYEAIMGFEVEVSTGRSIAIKPVKKHGAPATINLEELLKTDKAKRAAWLKERSDQDLTGKALELLKSSGTIDELLAALESKIANEVTPNVVPAGAMIFQPSDERRRSGSHYTPRSLTEPIVRTTLEPILRQLCGGGSGVVKEGSGVRCQGSGETQGQNPDTRNPTPETPSPDPRSPTPDSVWQPTPADKKRFTGAEIAERIRLSKIAVANARQAREVGTPHPSQILDLKICDPAMGSGAFLVETCRQLGDELIKAWYAHYKNDSPALSGRALAAGSAQSSAQGNQIDEGPAASALPLTSEGQGVLRGEGFPDIPADEDEVLYARRLIAQRCLYGVDKNIMAVDLAKLSLWLVTLAKAHPFTFLDHSLRHGDSLVGLTRQQIIGFHWEPGKQKKFGEDLIQKRLDRATEARAKILNAREDVPYRDQESRLAVADEALNVVRMTGDACVSAFFAGSKKKDREDRCDELFASVSDWYASGNDINRRDAIAVAVATLRSGQHPLPPFHWEIEFPEVFSRTEPGFDALVGNPPFAGKNTTIKSNGPHYLSCLASLHDASRGLSDLVAHFFRRCFSVVRNGGSFGLIATNTVSQGDTRVTGLGWIRHNGGVIYSATKRLTWPGQAAVVVSVIHVHKGTYGGKATLSGREVETITSYLFHAGSDEEPRVLAHNHSLAFIGSNVLGPGFTFDDADTTGLASSLAEMERLQNANPRNRSRIFPYIGGSELNNDPQQRHSRYVISFGDMTYEEASAWPDLLQIVELRVKGTRGAHSTGPWWQFERARPELYQSIGGLDRVLAIARVSNSFAPTLLPSGMVYSEKVVVFPFSDYSPFCALQCRVHEIWTRFFSSTLKDDLQYTPSACFDTFPFPDSWPCDPVLENAGHVYFTYRRDLMTENDEGLTKTYNRFHDPHEKSPEILHLRELHAAMDRAVLEAYGWHDLAQTARGEFLLDYEEEDDDNGGAAGASPSRRKKPWRLRWPDDFRDEVLARLLELNEQRHKEELLVGKKKAVAAEEDKTTKPKKPRKVAPKVKPTAADPFQQEANRRRRFVLLLLRAWEGKRFTRRALNAAMILMLNDKLRKALLDSSANAGRTDEDVMELNHVYTELSIDGHITVDGSGAQQLFRISEAAPSTDDAPQEDLDRIVAVREYFRCEAESGRVTETEETVDAEFDFVSA